MNGEVAIVAIADLAGLGPTEGAPVLWTAPPWSPPSQFSRDFTDSSIRQAQWVLLLGLLALAALVVFSLNRKR